MSRAFVKEPDGDSVQDSTPEIPISPHPNLVTPRGLKLLSEERAGLVKERSRLKASTDKIAAAAELARVERRLRYIEKRIESAIETNAQDAPTHVSFGCHVTVVDEEDRETVYAIVGEDEASPDIGLIGHSSPLARALMDLEVGDLAKWRRPKGDLELEIVAIKASS